MIILAPQFIVARFNRSLAGLRLSTDPELPGTSPIVLRVSIPTYPVGLFHAACSVRRLFRPLRHENALYLTGAKCDAGAENEAQTEATPTIDSQF